MTCIAGIASAGVVYIGGDSLGSNGITKTDRIDDKVFRVAAGGEWAVIGCTTSYRMLQILRYRLTLPAIDTWDIQRWMSTEFIDSCRRDFKEAGWGLKDTDGEERGGTFLVGVRDQLFTIEGDFQIGVPRCGYSAVGSGAQVALGSLFTSTGEAQARITTALEAASTHACGVGGSFTIVNTKGV